MSKRKLTRADLNKVGKVLSIIKTLNLDALEEQLTPQQINKVMDSILLLLSELKINSEIVVDNVAKQIRAGLDHLQTAVKLFEEANQE